MEIKAKPGDVFLIPIDDETGIGGQIVAIREDEELYVAIFDRRVRLVGAEPSDAISGMPVLLTLTFDAKLFHGEWPIIGSLIDALDRYPEPAFKVKHAGVMSVESRDKSVRRPATDGELSLLEYRSVAAPVIIEDVIKAHLGASDWNDSYNKRRADYAIESSMLL